MSVRLYVGNLPEDLNRQELEAVFADAEGVSAKIITDRKTGKCRGFGFVTVKNDEMADQIIEKFNGFEIKDSAIKIEKALPRSKDKGEEQAASPASSGGAASGKRKGGNNNNKSRRSTTTSSDPDSVQPDPRWAQELEKLKQMLATQTTNS